MRSTFPFLFALVLTGCGHAAPLNAVPPAARALHAQAVDPAAAAAITKAFTFHRFVPTIVGGTTTDTTLQDLVIKPTADPKTFAFTATQVTVRTTVNQENDTGATSRSTQPVAGTWSAATGVQR